MEARGVRSEGQPAEKYDATFVKPPCVKRGLCTKGIDAWDYETYIQYLADLAQVSSLMQFPPIVH